MKRILIIEDDVNLGTALTSVLQASNYSVKHLTGGKMMSEVLSDFNPDLVIMDIMLNEDKDGFQLSRIIRMVSIVPILFTTSWDGNEDFEQGFAIENSDYVRKPYKIMEIQKRIERMLLSHRHDSFSFGNFTFVPQERSLKYARENINLNNYESAVLNLLCQNLGKFVDRNLIVESVWNVTQPKLKEASLNNIISSLRKYLSIDNLTEVETRVGLGVRLVLKLDK